MPSKPRQTTHYPRAARWEPAGAELARLLAERRITQSALALQIGTRRKNVNRWCKGYEFTPANQRLAARALDLPDDHFGATHHPPKRGSQLADRLLAEQLDAETREAFGRFLRESKVAAAMTAEDLAILRSVRFPDRKVRPTKAFFEAMAYALLGAIRHDEVLDVAHVNAALDATLDAKRKGKGHPEK